MENDLYVANPVNVVRESPVQLRREFARLFIVGALLATFGALVIASITATADAMRWQTTEKMLCLLLAPVAGLLGTALGFYFRIEQRNETAP